MKVKFDCNLEAWIQNVEIEADSLEEAEEALYRMSVRDLLENAYIHSSDISNVDSEIVEQDFNVKVYNIEFDPEDILDYGVDKDLPDETTVLEYTFTDIRVDRYYEDLEMYISDAIFDKYGLIPTKFDFDYKGRE